MSQTKTGGPPQIIEVLLPGGPPGPPGPQGPPGASTLTDLTDVTGPGGPGTSPVDDGTSTFPLTRVTTQEDLDAILASVAQVDWRTLDLQPGFEPYRQGFGDPQYRLTLNNVIRLEGVIGCNPPLLETDVGKLICTMPADSAPSGRLLFGCPASGNNVRVDVDPDGRVWFQGTLLGAGQIDWFSVTPISYSYGGA